MPQFVVEGEPRESSIPRKGSMRRALQRFNPTRLSTRKLHDNKQQLAAPVSATTPETYGEISGAASFPDGVKVLHDCLDAKVDVCFIHGLSGDRENTWTAAGQSHPWPQTLLPSRLKDVRILTYGYDAYVTRVTGTAKNSIVNHATNLLKDLADDRAHHNASSRPIIFVVHSLGGLVCKEALLLSRNHNDVHLRTILESTRGIAFLGAPHKGSRLADWAVIPASVLGVVKNVNKSLLQILQADNTMLGAIRENFDKMLQELSNGGREIQIACFCEELPLKNFGKIIVSQDSATVEGYSLFTIHADHRDMVRFHSAEDTGFKRLLGELARWSQWVEKPATSLPDSSTETEPSGPAPNTAFLEDVMQCLKSLAFREMDSCFHDIEDAAKDTCNWVFEHNYFHHWLACNQSLLWIKGKPGSGKSTLLRSMLNGFLDKTRRPTSNSGQPPLLLSFFFHGRGVELQKSPLGLYRALLHQILSELPDTLPDLVATCKKRRNTHKRKQWDWHPKELQEFFQEDLPRILERRNVYIFIDALDECDEQSAVNLVKQFESILAQLPYSKLQCRICFACRHYPILSLDTGYEICVEDENGRDIQTFVHHHLVQYQAPKEIEDAIQDRACGIFIWASFMLQKIFSLLRAGAGWKKIESKINTTPPELDILYQGLIQDMDERPLSLRLFEWLCFAKIPLLAEDMRWALIVNPNCPCKSLEECKLADEYDCDMKRRIKVLSHGLAEIVPSGVVQFIHQSVKDFFMDKGLCCLNDTTGTEAATHTAVVAMAHYKLSRSCIRYLMMPEIEDCKHREHKRRFEVEPVQYCRRWRNCSPEIPFVRYALEWWLEHTKEGEMQGVSPDDLLDFVSWPSENFIRIWTMLYGRWLAPLFWLSPYEGSTLLHIAVQHQLTRPMKAILQKSSHDTTILNARNNRGKTPLLCAVEMNNNTAIRQLLATSHVSIDVRDSDGKTLLMQAAFNGDEELVKMLLASPEVDAGQTDTNGCTALFYACDGGNEAVADILLTTAQLHIKDSYNQTPLFYAAMRGNVAIMKRLLATGQVDIDARDKYFRTAFSYAAGTSLDAAQLLYATGQVDVNNRCKRGWTPLFFAAEGGREDVVAFLRSISETKFYARGKDGYTADRVAFEMGHEDLAASLRAFTTADMRALVLGTGDTFSEEPFDPEKCVWSLYWPMSTRKNFETVQKKMQKRFFASTAKSEAGSSTDVLESIESFRRKMQRCTVPFRVTTIHKVPDKDLKWNYEIFQSLQQMYGGTSWGDEKGEGMASPLEAVRSVPVPLSILPYASRLPTTMGPCEQIPGMLECCSELFSRSFFISGEGGDQASSRTIMF